MVTALGQRPEAYRSWHHLASRPAAPIRVEPRGVLLRMSLLGAVLLPGDRQGGTSARTGRSLRSGNRLSSLPGPDLALLPEQEGAA
jgi:hypothetical protein